MENNTKQYYTPELWEFCDGFEFEIQKFDFVNGGYLWRNETYLLGREFYYPLKDILENKEIRVKYLEKEDIESLGFVFVKAFIRTPQSKYWGKDFTIWFDFENNILEITSKDGVIKYLGKIRNKFHLQQILKDIS